uniref:glutathione transferase n=1 Tax=Phaedon brassicae TaxID=154011 RepID=A0A9Y1LQ70_9CUCU|nr:glutathione S-transferase [Phaedon brassicae]WET52786.1 glutathione S-transferase [Phaedon brassicae]
MAPAYKLTYFNLTGLGEVIRFLFHYGGIEFEDVRIEQFTEWPAIKSKMPFGQMPILEYNGKTYYQCRAIARYLAKQVKLVGKDDLENLEIDQTADIVSDLFQKIVDYYYEPDQKVKKNKEGPTLNELLPSHIGKLEKQIQNNNGYLVGGHLTWADLHLVGATEYISFMSGKDIVADTTYIKALKQKVHALPGIKEYISKRPNVA